MKDIKLRMRSVYFRGAGTYKFESQGHDGSNIALPVSVNEHGEFELSSEQFATIPAIGVYASRGLS